MNLTNRVKPISYLKAHAAEVLKSVREDGQPMVITQNGEAKAVVQDIADYEQTQETLALLKMLAMSERDKAQGRVYPVEDAFADIRARLGDTIED